jgi:hypothetical protein
LAVQRRQAGKGQLTDKYYLFPEQIMGDARKPPDQ